MPRGFNDQEKEGIRRALVDAGRVHFSRFGLRKTNVAELAQQVGIAKGSFYLFFESKEELFAAVIVEVELELRTALLQELERLEGSPRAMFKRLLSYPIEVLETHPILRILTDPEEAQAIFRKIPQSQLHANQEDDDVFFGRLLEQWQAAGWLAKKDPRAMSGMLRAIFTLTLQRDIIGREQFQSVVELMIDALTDAFVIDTSISP